MPWPYHRRSWQVLGPGVVLGVSMEADRPWLGGGAPFRLSQRLSVQPRHRLCAYWTSPWGITMKIRMPWNVGGRAGRFGRGNNRPRNNCPNDAVYLALHALLV